jgi:2,3-bisphosphoglycerate-dependent phosphoglycerate mutase
VTLAVLTRHGESEWNAKRQLTGWSDPPLSNRGARQARDAGALLGSLGLALDRVYTSVLGRATQTAAIMLVAVDGRSVPVLADWRLNERHLGRLEGLTKAEVTGMWGNDRRRAWRDDDLALPPPLDADDPAHPRYDHRYRDIPPDRLPGSERRCDVAPRVLEFWQERVAPDIAAGLNVMVVSHLGPLRVLGRHLGCPTGHDEQPARWPNASPILCPVKIPSG